MPKYILYCKKCFVIITKATIGKNGLCELCHKPEICFYCKTKIYRYKKSENKNICLHCAEIDRERSSGGIFFKRD